MLQKIIERLQILQSPVLSRPHLAQTLVTGDPVSADAGAHKFLRKALFLMRSSHREKFVIAKWECRSGSVSKANRRGKP